MHPLVARVKSFILEYKLINKQEHVLIGFSGGADSAALTAILMKLREVIGFTITLFHLNHQLRGAESDRDEDFVIEWSRNQRLPLRVERANVGSIRKTRGGSLEETARMVRYQTMEKVASELGAERMAVGHNMDDQAETVLLNLFRGSGKDGLRGMPPARGQFIRPLLSTGREDIDLFLSDLKLPFIVDSTNRDLSFSRNRIRHQFIPLIAENFNPKIREALFRLTMNIQEEGRTGKRISLPLENAGEVKRIPISFFSEMPQAQRIQALREFLRIAYQDLRNIYRQHLKSLDRLVMKGKGEVCLPGRALVRADEGYLWGFRSHLIVANIPEWSFPLCMPGHNVLSAIGLVLEAQCEPFSASLKGNIEAVLDKSSLRFPLLARSFQPGDRMVVGKSEKKIKEIFAENAIPVEWRKLIPLVCDNEKIIWIPGIALDERVKVRDNSSSVYFRCSRLSSR